MRGIAVASVLAWMLSVEALAVTVPKTANPYIPVVVKLYDSQEYEAALDTLHKAEGWPGGNGNAEIAWLSMMEGVLYTELGDKGRASIAFKRGLTLDSNAQPPVEDPRVTKLYKQARESLGLPSVSLNEPTQLSPVQPTSPPASLEPAARTTDAPSATNTSSPGPTPPVLSSSEADSSPPTKASFQATRAAENTDGAWIALGTGVLLGGVGAGLLVSRVSGAEVPGWAFAGLGALGIGVSIVMFNSQPAQVSVAISPTGVRSTISVTLP